MPVQKVQKKKRKHLTSEIHPICSSKGSYKPPNSRSTALSISNMLGTRPGEIPGVKEADEVGKDFLRQLQD